MPLYKVWMIALKGVSGGLPLAPFYFISSSSRFDVWRFGFSLSLNLTFGGADFIWNLSHYLLFVLKAVKYLLKPNLY